MDWLAVASDAGCLPPRVKCCCCCCWFSRLLLCGRLGPEKLPSEMVAFVAANGEGGEAVSGVCLGVDLASDSTTAAAAAELAATAAKPSGSTKRFLPEGAK